MKKISLCLLVILALLPWACKQTSDQLPKELTEAEKRKIDNALATMNIHDGLEAKVFAYEPMLINPTNMDIDAKGRVWVCEAYNYRPNLNQNNSYRNEGDRILILEDTDGDGVADQKTVFYQGEDINAALGIAVLGKHVYVSASPNLLVFTDEDGDDIPEKKEILFSGIKGEQHDHGLHAVVFGPDGKLYFNFGNAGKELHGPDGALITDIHGRKVSDSEGPFREGMIFRCNPDGSDLEVIAHNFRNNYEVAVDAFGAIWQSDNDDDGNKGVRINYVMEHGNYGYKDEMTGASWKTRRTGMHEEIPLRHWHQNDPGVVPNLLQTGAGSPTGLVIYEGGLLPEVFHNQMIHADAGPNVVRAYPVQTKGAGYTASIENIMQSEGDSWFRPADICIAPDGSLFVADWYDPGVGGHQMGDQAQGRVYRLAPKGSDYQWTSPELNTAEGAAQALSSPNMSVRYQAWQALKNMGETAIPAAEAQLKSEDPRVQARALWFLASEDPAFIDKALTHENDDIRTAGIRMATRFQPNMLHKYLAQVTNDPSAKVRREALVALRYLQHPSATNLWLTLAEQYNGQDRWYLEALGIAADPHADTFTNAWLAKVGEDWKSMANQDITWRLRGKNTLPLLAELIAHPASNKAIMERNFRAFDFHTDPSKDVYLTQLMDAKHPKQAEIDKIALSHLSKDAIQQSEVAQQKLKGLLVALKTEDTGLYLEWVKRFELRDELPALIATYQKGGQYMGDAAKIIHGMEGLAFFNRQLQQPNSQNVHQTLEAMTHLWGKEVWESIKTVALDESKPMATRKKAAECLAKGWQQEDWALKLVKDDGLPTELKQPALVALMGAYKGSIRKQAIEMLGQEGGSSLAPVAELVTLEGNVANGKGVYTQNCSSCHQVNGEGIQFGPDLSEIGSKLGKDGLYAAILYPSAGISFGFEGYVLKTNNNETVVGYISSKTETDVEITVMGGRKQQYPLSKVASLEPLENSLMTEGLHLAMNQQELVDLVAYLTTLKKAEKVAVR